MSYRTLRFAIPLGIAAALVVALPAPAQAQFGGLGKKIKEKATQRANQKEDEAAQAAVDAADPTKAKSAVPGDKAATAETAPSSASGPAARTRTVAANYDFVPGQRTLYYNDFTDEQVGNFPRRLGFGSGSMEVVELDGQRALKASTSSGFVITLPETLPEKFTIELDVVNRNSNGVGAATVEIFPGGEADFAGKKTHVAYGHNGWDVDGGGTHATAMFTSEERGRLVGQPVGVKVLGDGPYLKLYADTRRLANVPNADFPRSNKLFVQMEARDDGDNAVYVTRIRVAESQKTIYDALASTGKWATQGILFETGKAEVRPESAPTLREIASALKAHPELKVQIGGHTDNVGQAAANQKLSQARADAVKAALVADYGIADDRMETRGFGDTKPVASNGSAEGRANNRRVEFIKL